MTMPNKSKILFVDDEPFVLDALRRVFQNEDFQVLFASSGLEAIGIMENSSVQMIVSDFRMPGMNGGELLRVVSERWPDSVRVILSGYADIASVVSAINDGQIYKFVTKPWRNEELQEIVRTGVEKYWQQIELQALAEATLAQNDSLMSTHLDGLKRLNQRHFTLEERVDDLEAYRWAFSTLETPALLFRDSKCLAANDAAQKCLHLSGAKPETPTEHPVIMELARRLATQVTEGLPQSSVISIQTDEGRTLPIELVTELDPENRIFAIARFGTEWR
jgi:response regulator RpfG family c-di-GMP phosphodiesterase